MLEFAHLCAGDGDHDFVLFRKMMYDRCAHFPIIVRDINFLSRPEFDCTERREATSHEFVVAHFVKSRFTLHSNRVHRGSNILGGTGPNIHDEGRVKFTIFQWTGNSRTTNRPFCYPLPSRHDEHKYTKSTA